MGRRERYNLAEMHEQRRTIIDEARPATALQLYDAVKMSDVPGSEFPKLTPDAPSTHWIGSTPILD
ncbi:hypothetical protein NDI54_16790 [Haloarcula sp. S1AR25-5A]|uniref:Uncharacterized protein n=1 Tax=Haloarcula terrestris TaxID=2950533 RepID=A0AAE4F0V0_9EURY|nr:hypothetical protein [Haloarcula terrestris]MDS0223004.1 hypothetical protein [Haloarcula terrestris]